MVFICYEESVDNKVGIQEFEKFFPISLNFLALREFNYLYEKSSGEERKILTVFAETNSKVLTYKEIKEDKIIKSEPSIVLRNMINKNLIVKKSRGKYKLRDRMFKEYLRTYKPYKLNGTI